MLYEKKSHRVIRIVFSFLQQQKQNVEDLQQAVSNAKAKYREAMSNLEGISEEIHESRKLPLPPREPGVGCESDDEFPSEINLGKKLKRIFPPVESLWGQSIIQNHELGEAK